MPEGATKQAPRIWSTTLMFAITLAVALVAVPWFGLTMGFDRAWVLFVSSYMRTAMSITGGYHRLWAHKSYDAHWSLKLIYLVFGTMALQNSVFIWASGHRTHHLNVDDVDKDLIQSAAGLVCPHRLDDPGYESGKPDLTNIPDLRRDPMLAFQHRFYVPLHCWPILDCRCRRLAHCDLWGTLYLAGVLRLVVSHHVTFFINSLAHMWGSRPYTDENTARETVVLAFLHLR